MAYFFDADDDGDIEGEEYKADGNGGSDAYTAAGEDVSLLREVRVNLVVRTRSEDQNFNRGRFQATENRSTFPTGADGFRRRVFTSTVMPRNVGTRITGL